MLHIRVTLELEAAFIQYVRPRHAIEWTVSSMAVAIRHGPRLHSMHPTSRLTTSCPIQRYKYAIYTEIDTVKPFLTTCWQQLFLGVLSLLPLWYASSFR
jgi:hypothetical protein